MKKHMRRLLTACMACLLLICLIYFGLALYYRSGFALNTWINGVYCTGRTVEEVNVELLSRFALPDEITVTAYDASGARPVEREWQISLREAGLTADYTGHLQAYLAAQNPWLWVDNITLHREHTLLPALSCEEGSLREQWSEIVSAIHREEDYRIAYSEEEGYSLYDGLRDHLDEGKAYRVLLDAVAAGKSSVNLIEEGCYSNLAPTQAQESLAALWKQIEEFQNSGPVYDLGDGAEQLDSAVMAGFLKKADQEPFLPLMDEQDCLQIAEGTVDSYVEELAEQHDTQGKEWEFQSTSGDVVTVKGVTYGTAIDRERELEWLSAYLQALVSGKLPEEPAAPHIPEYTKDAFNRSSTSIGGTYIEADMGQQKLYYYEGGELKLETDIVTGNARRRMNTPEGVNYVYAKQKNRVLRGQGYATPVDYWMPVKGAIGIHDADWRDKFGGEIYKTNGSHGCINVPPDVMADLYDMVEIGTPVVMFYGEEE